VLDDQPGALADYMRSLERLLTELPRTIYPGHGPVVADAVGKLREYLDHRTQRVEQVFAALAARQSATPDELAAAIYVDVAPNLMPMAARNVRVALEKLESDGRIEGGGAGEGDRWRIAT
jgi:glyoxylase-like metal-dependent hydrolase (beta-lactamase superfamily II)